MTKADQPIAYKCNVCGAIHDHLLVVFASDYPGGKAWPFEYTPCKCGTEDFTEYYKGEKIPVV